jgi:endonuclease YncB( thermonuclease family)
VSLSLYTYRARVRRVVDGDTIDLDWVDLGWGVRMFPTESEPLRLRFAGVNAYETSLRGDTTEEEKALGKIAKAWLAGEVEGCEVLVRTVKGGERGNFGRFLVWVHDATGAICYNTEIIDRGWGVAV